MAFFNKGRRDEDGSSKSKKTNKKNSSTEQNPSNPSVENQAGGITPDNFVYSTNKDLNGKKDSEPMKTYKDKAKDKDRSKRLGRKNQPLDAASIRSRDEAQLNADSFVYQPEAEGTVDDSSFHGEYKTQSIRREIPSSDPYHPGASSLEERFNHDFEGENKILRRSIKRVGAFVLAMFIALMSYMVYFQVTRADALRTSSGNRRNAEARNKVLRGSIYDRNGKVLSLSTLSEDGTQIREYPGGQAFGNILGYVSNKYSVTGLEASMDQELSKAPGIESIFTKDFISSLINPEQGVTKQQEGNSLHLTLDTGLQRAAYEALDGRKGSVVALDPKTGEILAMVSSPGFSAEKLDEVMKRANSDEAYAAQAPLINRAIKSVYAPGSTMKVVTLAAGLENIPDLETRIFDDQGRIEFADGSTLNNFNNNVYGEIGLEEAFTKSSNYVFGSLGMELRAEELRRAAEDLGFNAPIKMEGMTARQSVFPTLSEAEVGNKALVAIGQGAVSATPLQMAMVAGAVANDGRLVQPAIIGSITDKDDNVVSESGEPELSLAMTREVATKVKEMMIKNVTSGSSSYQSLSKLNGAGKTGTAQFAVDDGTRVHAWFIGFAPQENPEIAFAVVVEDLADVNENTGARQAIPVAKDILTYWKNR